VSGHRSRETLEEIATRVAELERRLRDTEAERDEFAGRARAAEASIRTRDEILAAVTHDLRNPLGTIVMGATALLQQGTAGDPRAQRVRAVTERIHRQAERMSRQIRDLQDFSEIEAGRFAVDERTPHAVAALVGTTGELVGPVVRERGIAFDVCIAPELTAPGAAAGTIQCDAERIVQALSGLVATAIKVTTRGGSIEVGARSGEHGGPELFVRDSGPGIPDDELPGLFEPAWRSKQPGYRGATLYFTIARAVAVAHGGTIRVTSARGGGTTVWLALPPARN
jgi:signal transduction histidine kinase